MEAIYARMDSYSENGKMRRMKLHNSDWTKLPHFGMSVKRRRQKRCNLEIRES